VNFANYLGEKIHNK